MGILVLMEYQPEHYTDDEAAINYLGMFLEELYIMRDYNYRPSVLTWNENYPIYFRNYRGFVLDNRRHKLLSNCEEYDQDPLIEDLSIMSSWGTGEGISYTGEWGIVTNRAKFGSFFSEKDSKGNYSIIGRQNVNAFPDHGTLLK